MIPARKGGPGTWLWSRYVDRKFRASFRGLWARGVLPKAEAPLLVYANHTNWWDGFVAHQLCRAAGWDVYCVSLWIRTIARPPRASSSSPYSLPAPSTPRRPRS